MSANPTTRSQSLLVASLRYLIRLSLCLFVFSYVHAQTYYFDTYNATRGVSSQVYCILQDQYNMIWLGTPGGAVRFNGNQFENFTEEYGLASQGVRAILLDTHKNIWFGHLAGGISVYSEGHFRKFEYLDSLMQSDVTSIFEDKKERIWITTASSGAFMIEDPYKSPEKYLHFTGKNKLSDRVFNYCLTEDNSIYLITDVGIRQFLEGENQFKIFHPKGLTSYFSVITMYEDHDKNFWFGTYHGGLYKYEPKTDTVLFFDIRDGLSSNWISTLMQDSKKNLWIGTFGGGITRLDENGFKIFNASNGLEAEQIYAIYEDVEGNILIGSRNKGFSIYKGDLIEHYSEKDGLINPEVYAIKQDINTYYWIGTNSGIQILQENLKSKEEDDEFTRIQQNVKDVTRAIKVRFLEIDQNRTTWIGTEDKRVLFYDPTTRNVHDAFQINRYFTSQATQSVSSMRIDRSNNLWIGTGDGLLKYSIGTGEVHRFSNNNELIGNDITALYCDASDQVWVGAYIKNGISKIVNGTQVINYSSHKAFTPTCFVNDKQGKLWIGTRNQGIFILEGDSIIEQSELSTGLLSNLITTLNVDENNVLYIGTTMGLNVYDQQNQQIKTYNQKNGFVGIEINLSSSFYNNDEKNILFGTNFGINKYNIEETKSIATPPIVYLTQLNINSQLRNIEPQLKLHFYENQISISYESICLTNSDAVRYRVMLEGLNKDWQESTSQTTMSYQSLPPGKYRFKVISRNSEGIWSSEPASLEFMIKTPIYKRWYIIIPALVLILFSFWLFVRIRERNLIREKKILEDKVRDRTQKLEVANLELEDKNKNITDSIRYALRIQMSILPPEIPFQNVFVLFKPKDIVSGDFYWLASVKEKEIIAAIDCTGHGVPGAFMSFIGYSSLNEVVREKKIIQPSLILDALNKTVVTALNLQGEEAIKDGMDIAVVTYDPNTSELEYAGAYNPLYLIRKGDLQEYKADRFAIGKSSVKDKKFTNHTIKIEKGDSIYIFTDGYADQFGGEEDKKFKAVRVRELLLSMQDKSMSGQRKILNDTIESWRGDKEQVDDILFIGRRF